MNDRSLPLFPLPVVLFPGACMPLHVFEERYRRMVERCLDTDREFGLLYHDPDCHGPFLNERGRIGCVGHIREVRYLPDGRSLILVEGGERFSIVEEVDRGELFYEALVEPLGDEPVAREEWLRGRRRRSLARFGEVVRALGCPAEEIPAFDIESDVTFRLAACVQIDPQWQSSFLELTDEAQRLERLDAVFQAALDRDAIGDEVPP